MHCCAACLRAILPPDQPLWWDQQCWHAEHLPPRSPGDAGPGEAAADA
ncbi:MAG TPA: hypothetical protein VFH47_06760 [Candidatus Thermoplasmatota archaeon]|nr:hypothetical protein [Candidatus Thermoplasmatota archaeon]